MVTHPKTSTAAKPCENCQNSASSVTITETRLIYRCGPCFTEYYRKTHPEMASREEPVYA